MWEQVLREALQNLCGLCALMALAKGVVRDDGATTGFRLVCGTAVAAFIVQSLSTLLS